MLNNILHAIYLFVLDYGLWGIFALMFVENLGVPLPTEIGFIVGQSMVLAGRVEYISIFLVALFGKTLGSIISYFAGKYFADKIKHTHKNSYKLKNAQKTFSRWMEKYGILAVFLSRLIGYVRPWSSYIAGIGEVKFIPFIIFNLSGSIFIILLTMFVLGTVVNLWSGYVFLRPYIIAVLLLSFFGFWAWLALHPKRKK